MLNINMALVWLYIRQERMLMLKAEYLVTAKIS